MVAASRRPPADRLRRRVYEDAPGALPFGYLALRRGRPDVAHALYPTDAARRAARRDHAGGAPVVLSYMGIPHRASLANRRGRKEIVRAGLPRGRRRRRAQRGRRARAFAAGWASSRA